MDTVVSGNAYLFAEWRFDPILPSLCRRGPSGAWRTVPLGSRALAILALLVEQRGAILSRESIIGAVWPSTTVEPNNLTVQIAGLRRVLDEGREGESLIRTVAGQGYRLACTVQLQSCPAITPNTGQTFQPVTLGDSGVFGRKVPARHSRALITFTAAVLVMAAITIAWWLWAGPASPVSIVMVSVEDAASAATPSPTARALTEKVASDLARFHLFGVPNNVVTPSGPAMAGATLLRTHDARYALQGILRQGDASAGLDIQLVDTATGNQLWSQRLDLGVGASAEAQKNAVRRIIFGAGPVILTAELIRRQQEQPDHPTAIDLMLQARQLTQLPPSKQRLIAVRDLFELAVRLDPSSVILKGQLAAFLMDSEDYTPTGFKSVLERTRSLINDVQTAIPNTSMALRDNGQWLLWQDGRCPEAIEAARRLVDLYPDVSQGTRWLARCLVLTGRADEAVPLLEGEIRTSGMTAPWTYSSYRSLGDALLDLHRYKEAIDWYQRGLAANPDDSAESQSGRLSRIAIAQALDDDVAAAEQTMAHAEALWPHWTVRGEKSFEDRGGRSHARVLQLQEGLRLAGVRDHADENADFGVAPLTTLQQSHGGYTSLTLPGATTMRTADVAQLLTGGRAIIIDTVSRSFGPSLPGAIGLQYVGAGGSLTDLAQDRLRNVMLALTKGDMTAPILAVGWNSEDFDAANLALRLVALGYRNVLWYRGGREAWEASGAPETPLANREW